MPGQIGDQTNSDKSGAQKSIPTECDEELGQKGVSLVFKDWGMAKMGAQFVLLLCGLFLVFVVQRTQQAAVMDQIHNLESKVALYRKAVEETGKVGKAVQEQKAEAAVFWKSLTMQTTSVEALKEDTKELQKKANILESDLNTNFDELKHQMVDLKKKTVRGESESETRFEQSRFPALWKQLDELQGRVDAASPEDVEKLQSEVKLLQRKLVQTKDEIDTFVGQNQQERERRKRALQTELNVLKVPTETIESLEPYLVTPRKHLPLERAENATFEDAFKESPRLEKLTTQASVGGTHVDAAPLAAAGGAAASTAGGSAEKTKTACPQSCANVAHSCWLQSGASGRCYTDQGKQTRQRRPLEKSVCEEHGGIWCPDR